MGRHGRSTSSLSNTSAHEVPAQLYYNDEDNLGGTLPNNGEVDDAEESDSFYANNFESADGGRGLRIESSPTRVPYSAGAYNHPSQVPTSSAFSSANKPGGGSRSRTAS